MRSSLFPRLGQKYVWRLTTSNHCVPTGHVRHFARLGKRRPSKPRAACKISPPSVALDLCAHIVAPQINQSLSDCREFLLENPEHVQEFENDMLKTGMTVVFSNEEVCTPNFQLLLSFTYNCCVHYVLVIVDFSYRHRS